MAVLRHLATERRVALQARTVVGRSRRAHVHDDSMRMSGEHALMSWTGTLWELRDLGSRNGTWVNGSRVKPGERVALQVGSVISFGEEAYAWRMESSTPPAPLATDGAQWIEGESDLLGLPDLTEPEVLIERANQGWRCAGDPVEDGQIVQAAGQSWTVYLPEELLPTADAGQVLLSDVRIEIRVSSDQEYVEVTVHAGDRAHKLPPRSHHELLLLLARRRLSDAESQDGSDAEHGWVYSTELERSMRASSNQIYVGIHRARKEIAALGIVDGTDVIERRSTTRQVRLGVGSLAVSTLG